MSFALTTKQVREQTKTVTRRLGWEFLGPGDLLQAIVKGQGLRKGEHPERLGVIRVIEVRREPLYEITYDDIRREGFAGTSHSGFVAMFCASHHGCTPTTVVTRIAFEYVAPASASPTSGDPWISGGRAGDAA